MPTISRLTTDILILGSGGAGLFAALHAQQAAPDDPLTNRALGDFYLKRGIG